MSGSKSKSLAEDDGSNVLDDKDFDESQPDCTLNINCIPCKIYIESI